MDKTDFLEKKARWVRLETLKMHKIAPEIRIASSLSSVEIFVALYYGKLLRFDARNPRMQTRDRLIISKGHGSVCLYPILADLGFFDKSELTKVCKKGSFLGSMPDTFIPGYETINGSLGHGLGVACGIGLALKKNRSDQTIFVVVGDGELYEGAVWEAIMFAGHHVLDNIIVIVDENKMCMLDYCRNVLDLGPLENKFKVFNWRTATADGHDIASLIDILQNFKNDRGGQPKVLIADTKKGKGVPSLENDYLCHIRSLSTEEVNRLIGELEQ